MWARDDSVREPPVRVGSGGFEPPKLTHLIYTRNLLFTKQLLCQLSYVGAHNADISPRHPKV